MCRERVLPLSPETPSRDERQALSVQPKAVVSLYMGREGTCVLLFSVIPRTSRSSPRGVLPSRGRHGASRWSPVVVVPAARIPVLARGARKVALPCVVGVQLDTSGLRERDGSRKFRSCVLSSTCPGFTDLCPHDSGPCAPDRPSLSPGWRVRVLVDDCQHVVGR